MLSFLLAIVLTILSPLVGAQEAFVWRQSQSSQAFLLAHKPGQTPAQALQEYFAKLTSEERLTSLVETEELAPWREGQGLRYETGELTPLPPKGRKPRFIVVTNEVNDIFVSERVPNVARQLEAAGAEVVFLPVMHDLNLNAPQAKVYRQHIIKNFDAMLVLGGDDIDPFLYGDEVSYAIAVNRRRDVSELKFTKQFIEAQEGLSFGICRGHQMCAVSHGNRLVQDIQIERDAPMLHRDGDHAIRIDNRSPIFQDFETTEIQVNSYHHQEVVVAPDDPNLRVTATSLDHTPITEAMEFRNGLGASLQFHPELMDDEVGQKLMRRFVSLASAHKYGKQTCHEILKALP